MRALLLVLGFLTAAFPARAQEALIADLSDHLVAITTGFAGTDVLLFGAVDGPGDIVVVVRGPSQSQVVRRKDRVAGIWLNQGEAVVRNAPSFYRVAATRPLPAIAERAVLERHRIGVRHLNLEVAAPNADVPEFAFRSALIRLKQDRNLYPEEVLPVEVLGNRLFRARLFFPSNVPVGSYSVEVYLLRDGEVVSAQTTPLIISKIGVGADVFDFAQNQPAAYGLIAIILAAALGWLAAAVFRRV